MMDGHIHAVSEKDAGSRFYFSVVVDHWDEGEHPQTIQQRIAPGHLDGQRVLLVEDNQINQDLAGEVLRQAGLKVEVAGNGQEALNILSRTEFFAVLMDLRMPEMDGLEAIRRIRANPSTANLPVIALSAGVLKEEVEAALSAGFDYYLPKPIDFQELIELLQHIGGIEIPGTIDQPSPAMDIGHIDGIDFGRALRHHNNDVALLSRLLDDFITFYSDADASLQSMIEEGETGKAERLAHNIAGVAGSFGAMKLMSAARTLEHALIDGADTEADLQSMATELRTFNSAIVQFKSAAADETQKGATG
ncbi:MAG: response regulator [Gammaproteobacteria bacterium]|nr:response regulator [Gammaproteobacteria bacterium]